MELIFRDSPHERQMEFFMARAAHVAYGGARGGGKSWAMRRKLALMALCYPGLRALLLRRTLAEVRENHFLQLMTDLKRAARYYDKDRAFIFRNGSRIRLGYCEREIDVLQYQGQEYDVIGMEEATHFTEYQRDFLTTCNRGTRGDLSPRMYYTANPGGVGHSWFKRLFVDRKYRGNERGEDYIFIPARVYDNPTLIMNNPEYVRQLENLPDEMRRAHLEGDWDVLAGRFLPEFCREKHVIRPFEVPSGWRRFRSLDYGLDMTACYWWAVDDGGRCFIYKELYRSGMTLSEAARAILEATGGNEKIGYTVASPDLWSCRQESGQSGATVMEREGLRGLVRANNVRVPGWRVLRDYLAGGSLFIFENCVNLIKTLPMLQFDRIRIEDAAGEPHEATHAAESVRYGVMSRPARDGRGIEGPSGFYTPGEREELVGGEGMGIRRG